MPPYNTLLTSGGQGCIFDPAIPCKGDKTASKKKTSKKDKKAKTSKKDKKAKTSKKAKKTISKVSFHETSTRREIEMDDVARKIKGHEDWAILWDKMCMTPTYKELAKHSDIDTCLDKKQIPKSPEKRFPQLIGPFGGHTYYEQGLSEFSKTAFKSQKAFDKALLSMCRLLKGACLGIRELKAHKLVHGDISVRNVLVKDDKSYLIDFGLAYRSSNKKYIKAHLKFLMEGTDKIYDAYPYEYYLYHGHHNKTKLKEELGDMKRGVMRDYHEEHVRFHELILGKNDIDRELRDYKERVLKGSYKPNLHQVIVGVDTYSVGILLPTVIHDVAEEHGVAFETVHTLCRNTTHPEIFKLLRKMTEFYAKDRISPKDAYAILCEI